MAHFWMWVASFLTMAIFWKYMGLWATRKKKDFLQVQREHCKRLCNDISSLEKCLKAMEASSKRKVLNKNQCVHLFCKLILAMKGINQMLSRATQDLKFQFVCEELYSLQRKIENLTKNCIEEERWCHSAIFQLQNKETFRELLLDLKYCYDTARDMYLFHHSNQSNNILPIVFDATTYEQVLEDGYELKKKLELVPQGEVPEDYELVQHLLLRLRNLDRVDGGDLDALEIPNDFKPPKLIKKIAVGSFSHVYRSNWFGLPCATKVLRGDLEYCLHFRKEAGILAGLSHPNLVQFFGCGIAKRVDENMKEGISQTTDDDPTEDETREMHLVMELMDTSLSTILKRRKRPIPYLLAIDIMHQIAKGVYYLHDMQVAHLDLKPDNVLSSSIPMGDLSPHCIFKVMDYGTSQLEVCSNPKNPKPSKYSIGSPRYMSPEMIKGSKTPVYPFQADAWSFAMICSEILSRKIPYFGLNLREVHDQIACTRGTSSTSLRPDLPNNCKELTNLIQKCWSQDPLQRPKFSNICERLVQLKKSFLKGTFSCKMVPQFGPSCTLRDSKSIVDHVQKVNEQIPLPKEALVDLEHQLSKARALLKLNYIGIVGMGGIGKTTLAKAILDDAIVKSLYNASCFVVSRSSICQSQAQTSYRMLCEILFKLGNDQMPKNLVDAQGMMKEILVAKKVLLILDDVREEALVHDIVPANIVQASKGTTIILTTRNWSTIKYFVGIEGKLNVELLDEKAATMLFMTHLSRDHVSHISPDFGSYRKHVVRACNGLPLSLKVMGSFLRSKERLRSWEHALRRMARGRNLNGDEEIWNTLEISYDGLNDVEKNMFLDVACFFCRDVYPSGISKETILYMWSKDGILPMDELDRLIKMSLLKITEDSSILEMQDQLRDMGRRIAKGSRIWKASMILKSGFTNKDVEVLEGISLQGTMVQEDFEALKSICGQMTTVKQGKSFDFKRLRVLILVTTLGVSKIHLDNLGLLLQLSKQCSQLEAIIIGTIGQWTGRTQRLPTNIAINLQERILDLCGTHASLKILDLMGLEFLEQLPNKFASSHSLLRLNLSFCKNLVALPKELKNLSSLITLDLSGCSSLVALPNEVGNLSSLTTLYLSGCSSLVALPNEVGNLSSLTILKLKECSSLMALPIEVGNLSYLTTLDLSRCSSLIALPNEVGNLTSLTTLELKECLNLVALPNEVGKLTSLIILDLSGCSSLAALPNEVGNLSSLTTLELKECSSLMALPNEVGNLSSLTILYLTGCSRLEALPNGLGNLFSLTTLDLSGCSRLVVLPNEVGNLSSLTTFSMWRCSSLLSLPNEIGNLSSLTTLYLHRCSRLAALPNEVGNLYSLTTFSMWRCSRLVVLPNEVGNLSSLTTLDLSGCSRLVVLPNEIGNLSSLTILKLKECSSLMALPNEVGNLSSLTTLNLSWCLNLVALPNEVGNLSSLTILKLKECSSLMVLPNEVGNLSSLTTLNLSGCSKLVTLPNEVGNLSSLTILDLDRCSRLVALPNEVGNLSSLITLNLNWCSSLVALPKEVGNLSSLTNLELRGCSSSMVLPKKVGKLSSLTTPVLDTSSSLVALPKEVGNLSSLTILDLRGSSSLAPLPKEVEILNPLMTLQMDECSSSRVEEVSSLTTSNLDGCSNLVASPNEIEIPSSLMPHNLEVCSSKAQIETRGDDEHVLKEQYETAMIENKAKYDLSQSSNNTTQEPFLKLLSFLTNLGLCVYSFLLLWVQICIGMSKPQAQSWTKGKVESKDLLTKRFLGQGCSGFFYETIWLHNRKIKFARKDFPGVKGDTFVMEAIRLFELRDHPNLVKTFCWSVDNRSCSLVMEYMKDDLSSFMQKRKKTLRKKGDQKVIKVNPFPFQLLEALDILLQIAIGVEYIHDKGICHGDLKPNNVFLDWKEGRMLVKVADFGLRETKRNASLLSHRALCFQMIEWSAPELFEDFFNSMSEDFEFLRQDR